jgi:DNA (cytosine-5)-methyltransferase 1
MKFIDLFAGAGGLSEGFIRAGMTPVAHVEMDGNACDTIRTRIAFHHLKAQGRQSEYNDYLKGGLSREELWSLVPSSLMDSVIETEISELTIPTVFSQIDRQLGEEKVQLIIGGPPCQAYSLVGRSRDPNRMADDKRNYLFKHYAEFLVRYEPKYFVFENVLGLLTAGNKRYFNEMTSLFAELGYSTDYKILNSEDYGVLQKRRRVIIIGRRGNEAFTFPQLEERSAISHQVLRDLFADLPKLKPGEGERVMAYAGKPSDYLELFHLRNGVDFVTQHISRPHNTNDLGIYRKAIEAWTEKGERLKYDSLPVEMQSHKNTASFLDRYKVVDGSGLSHTMVAHIAKDGHYYIFPDLEQVRSISVREAARIQSFPDDYYFEGGRSAAFKQIGNAVPPLMAEAIAAKIFNLCLEDNQKFGRSKETN